MLRTNVAWPADRMYNSGTEWEPLGFFSDALCCATTFDIKLGFFSSSAINVLSCGFAAFLYNGGRMRMVINDVLSEPDKQALMVAESGANTGFFNLRNVQNIAYTLSRRDRHFFECLAWLIRNGRLEIKVVAPLGGCGVAHTKCGVLGDGINRVAFNGSCNLRISESNGACSDCRAQAQVCEANFSRISESNGACSDCRAQAQVCEANFSRMALMENIESVTAFCDWDGEGDKARVASIAASFEHTFSGQDPTVRYLSASQIVTHITTRYDRKELAELLQDEQEMTADVPALMRARECVQCIVASERQRHEEEEGKPHFPYPTGPRAYQRQAFDNWKTTQRGLFAMATGTGKTITSLNCLLEIYKRLGYYKALILVPTITLVNQWEEECRKFNFRHVVKVCSRNPRWRQQMDAIEMDERMDPTGKRHSYVVISTYASYGREDIAKRLNTLPRRTLLIADEAHNMGSGQILKRLGTIPFQRCIGLSATPQRQYDEEGNKALAQFFGCQGGYTFHYSMADAIENGVLCRYYYYPHVVKLTAAEMEQYLDISRKLAKYYHGEEMFRPKDDPILTALLLKRKRIIHKAKNKLATFRHIIAQRMQERGDLRYTLVYAPEGSSPDEQADDFATRDTVGGTPEDESLIDLYTQAVCDLSPTTTVRKFTAASADRDAMLADFAAGRLQVLTSMKCLDEGVDVPRSELAIFCASTGNPRQFVQRRGRILRAHPHKHVAVIHDLVVAPQVGASEDTYQMERNLLASELRRVHNFASLSENMADTLTALDDVLQYYNLSIFNH